MTSNYFDQQHKRTRTRLSLIAIALFIVALLLLWYSFSVSADLHAELPDHDTLLPIVVVSTDYLATCNTQYVNAMPQFTKLRIDSLSDNAHTRYLKRNGIEYVYVACDSYGLYTAIVADEIGNEFAVGIFIGRGESVADAIEALAIDHIVRMNATYVDP